MTAFGLNDKPMLVLHVKEMASDRDAGLVKSAVKALDRNATIQADTAARRLEIAPNSAGASELVEVLADAGFTATIVVSTVEAVVPLRDSRNQDQGPPPVDGNAVKAEPVAGVVSTTASLLPAAALGPLDR